jgi:hypothetical protein
MSVVFKSFETVEIDGVAAGNLLDVLSNHAARRTEVLDAYRAYYQEVESERTALQTRIDALLQEVPFNPRIIDASAFFERITKEEFAKLSTSDDAMHVNIAKTIIAYKDNDWPVVFESEEMQQLLGYLLQTGMLSEERKAELTKDATRSEAYSA